MTRMVLVVEPNMDFILINKDIDYFSGNQSVVSVVSEEPRRYPDGFCRNVSRYLAGNPGSPAVPLLPSGQVNF